MRRNVLSVLTALGLLASVFAAPAKADPPTLPEAPNVVDDQGDAETGSTQGDLWHAWFTEDGGNLSIHWNNAAAPPPSAYGTEWRIFASPNAEGTECLLIRAQVPGGAFVGTPKARIFDACGDGTNWFNNFLGEAEVEYGEMSEGGYITATFEKSATPLIADGATISAPRAAAYFIVGDQERVIQPYLVDDSEPGTDYEVGGGEAGESGGSDPEAGGETDEPAKENCKKYKSKKKRKACKKRNKQAQQGSEDEAPEAPGASGGGSCAAWTPGERGAEAPTTVVTDAATAEAPLELTLTTEAGTPAHVTELAHNFQVDTSNKDAGLYVRIDFYDDEDLDLYLKNPDDSVAAQAAGFNPAPVVPQLPVIGGTDGRGKGGHSEMGAEQVDGVLTADCGGYTAQFDEYYGYGGERVVTVWLGEATWDPETQEPIEE